MTLQEPQVAFIPSHLLEKQLQLLVEATTEYAIFLLSTDGHVQNWNAGAERIKGYTPQEIVGQHFSRFYPPEAVRNGRPAQVLELAAHYGSYTEQGWRLRKNGSRFWASVTVTALRGGDGTLLGYGKVTKDLTEMQVMTRQLTHDAMHDALTGLANRSLLLDRMEHALRRSRRARTRIGVFFIDLNKFKRINDSFGHGIGDEVLVQTAQRLRAIVRPGDTVARLGGDEFVILAEGIRDDDMVRRIAERIRTVAEQPVLTSGGHQVIPGCSVGITVDSDRSPEDLLQQADTALYEAKRRRDGGGWELFDEAMRDRARRQLEIEGFIGQAIAGQGLVVHYQPMVDLKTGRPTGAEALARLDVDGDGRLLPPGEFIPVAEDSGLILGLGDAVLRQVCMDYPRLSRENRDFVVAVNVSARQLHNEAFATTALQQLARHGVPARALRLELTESSLLDTAPPTMQTLERFRAAGVSLALDDFGTGWSSLSNLRTLPIDTIKVDRSFVSGVSDGREDAALTRGIIELAHALGKNTIAEGIETAQQRRLLGEFGCREGQGFLLGKPVPLAELSSRRVTPAA